MKECLHCKKPIENNRKKFCRDLCKYWYNQIRKEKEKHLPPVRKRTKNFFSMVVGEGRDMRGQGKRSGGMIKGGMSAMISFTIAEWVEINYENIKKHFTCLPHYRPACIHLGDGTTVKEREIYKTFGIKIDF